MATKKKVATRKKVAKKAAPKKTAARKKAAVKKKAPVTSAAEKMPLKNGIRRPKDKTVCGQVWAIADKLTEKRGGATPIKPLLIAAEKKGYNAGNVRAEYARWRKFNGVKGRIVDTK